MNIDSNFRGNIYVIQDGRILMEHVSGFADLANEIPNTMETKFASASAGKVFVATAILQLIEQGKLNFGDTLGKLFDIDLHDIDVDAVSYTHLDVYKRQETACRRTGGKRAPAGRKQQSGQNL